MPTRKSKPVGNAIAWSEADIARLASITDEDVAAAKSHAARLMPNKLKPLLNAKRRGRNTRPTP